MKIRNQDDSYLQRLKLDWTCLFYSGPHVYIQVPKGPNKQLIGMARESQRFVRECSVTAILILYGLPRLLTGYILAHEMMHAYLRLKGRYIM